MLQHFSREAQLNYDQLSSNLKRHCQQNEAKIDAQLNIYIDVLPSFAQHHQEALKIIGEHKLKRKQYIEKAREGIFQRHQPFLLKLKDDEQQLDIYSILPPFELHLNKLNSLEYQPEKIYHLMQSGAQIEDIQKPANYSLIRQIALEYFFELDWKNAIQHFLPLILENEPQKSPYLYLAMICTGLVEELNKDNSPNPRRTRNLMERTSGKISIWLEGDLKYAVYTKIQQSFWLDADKKQVITTFKEIYQNYRVARQSQNRQQVMQALCKLNERVPSTFPLPYLLKAFAPLTSDQSNTQIKKAQRQEAIKNIDIYCKLLNNQNKKHSQHYFRRYVRFYYQTLDRQKAYAHFIRYLHNKKSDEQLLDQQKIEAIQNEYNQIGLDNHQFQPQKRQQQQKPLKKYQIPHRQIPTTSGSKDQSNKETSSFYEMNNRFKRKGDCKNQLKQVVGLMNFYWYDNKGNIINSSQGTGFLIHPYVVITAKHNFWSKQEKCSNCTIQFVSANSQKILTFRSKHSSQWFQNPQLDVGAVFLKEPAQHYNDNIKFATRNDSLQIKQNNELLLVGYSVEYRKQNKPDEMKTLNPKFLQINTPYIEYKAETVGGLSGSPVICKSDSTGYYVISIHVSRKMSAEICRSIYFNDKLVNQIYFWIQSKFYRISNIKNSFNNYKNVVKSIVGSIDSSLVKFEKNLLTINKETNLEDILQSYRKKILKQNSNKELIQSVTSKLLLICESQEIKEFYEKLYIKDKVEFARNELQRLNLKCPSTNPLEQSQTQEQSQLMSILDFELFKSSLIQQQPSYLETQPQGFSRRTYFHKSHISQSSFFISFKKKQMTSFCLMIKYLEDNKNKFKFIPQHRIEKEDKDRIVYLVSKGIGYQKWWSSINRPLFLVLLKDLCKMIIELQQHKIYHTDMQLHNIILTHNLSDQIENSFDITIPSNTASISFKIIDFDYAFCLAQKGRRANLKIVMHGIRLLQTDKYQLISQPISSFVYQASKMKWKKNRMVSEMQNFYKGHYQSFLSNCITSIDKHQKKLLKQKQITDLKKLCDQRSYQKMTQMLETVILGETHL